MLKGIFVQKRLYYYYDTYPTWRQAYNVGRYYKRKNKEQYYIQKVKTRTGIKYKLYFKKRARL